MKNTNTYLFISLIFIFSCNTEAKFGFRKKVKVENHSIAKTIAKPHISKTEIKVDNTDTCEIITASNADEKTISPQTLKHNYSVAPSISIKKILVDSTNQKKKNDNALNKKELNIPAFLGFIFDYAILILPTIEFLNIQNQISILDPVLFLIALSLSLIGYYQIKHTKEKYWGLGFAYFGIAFFIAALILLFVWWIFVSLIWKGTP